MRIGLALRGGRAPARRAAVSPDVTFLRAAARARRASASGSGFASSQLTNVDPERDREGARRASASGANTTVRQIGAALGIAVIGSLLSAQMLRHATDSDSRLHTRN